MNIEEALQNIVDGVDVDEEIDALINERRVCRYIGPPQRRNIRGRMVVFRSRRCTGRPDPRKSRMVRRALKRGSVKRHRARAAKLKWRMPRTRAVRRTGGGLFAQPYKRVVRGGAKKRMGRWFA